MGHGYTLGQIVSAVPKTLMTPPTEKINIGLDSLTYAWARLESIGFVFGEKVRDIFSNENSFFSGNYDYYYNTHISKFCIFPSLLQQLLTR